MRTQRHAAMPRHTNPWALSIFALALLVGYAGCKPPKEIVKSYDYLVKKDPADSDTTIAVVEKPKVPVNSSTVQAALEEAAAYLGTPYRHGGINKNGIDCSGLAHKCYLAAGITIPRSTVDQTAIGSEVSRKELLPGDLVFFTAKNTGQIDHVGIIAKVEGPAVTFVHASSSKGVRYDRLDEGYWKDLFVTARRVVVN